MKTKMQLGMVPCGAGGRAAILLRRLASHVAVDGATGRAVREHELPHRYVTTRQGHCGDHTITAGSLASWPKSTVSGMTPYGRRTSTMVRVAKVGHRAHLPRRIGQTNVFVASPCASLPERSTPLHSGNLYVNVHSAKSPRRARADNSVVQLIS